jgi:hypothetical protein
MPFIVIRGTYHIVGYDPDGDSVRFQANDKTNWDKLSGRVDLNAREHAQLRLEGIDTLETHFQGQHQPMDLAVKALDFLLHELKITGAQFDPLMLNVTNANDGTAGYIVTREAEHNGRPVAFAFSGDPPKPDGSSVFFTTTWMKDSLNYHSVLEGLAYPTYYTGLFPDLRGELTHAMTIARAASREIWSRDATMTGFAVPDLQAITTAADKARREDSRSDRALSGRATWWTSAARGRRSSNASLMTWPHRAEAQSRFSDALTRKSSPRANSFH